MELHILCLDNESAAMVCAGSHAQMPFVNVLASACSFAVNEGKRYEMFDGLCLQNWMHNKTQASCIDAKQVRRAHVLGCSSLGRAFHGQFIDLMLA